MQNRDPTKAFRSMFGGCQIIMGMPTFCFWEDILKLYPNAKVILTVRSEDGWWKSVSKDIWGEPVQTWPKLLCTLLQLTSIDHFWSMFSLSPIFLKDTQAAAYFFGTLDGSWSDGTGQNRDGSRCPRGAAAVRHDPPAIGKVAGPFLSQILSLCCKPFF